MSQITINLKNCTTHFKVERINEDTPGVKQITQTISTPQHRHIAEIVAYQIDRSKLREGRFYFVLKPITAELLKFAKTLFDQNGTLKPEFIEHNFHKGSGCWGEELNEGMLLYIEKIEVNEKFRRSGIGSWAVKQLLSSSKVGSQYVFALPAPYSRGDDVKELQMQIDAFFQKHHFRRVGRTGLFAFSRDPDHPSRAITTENNTPSNIELYSRPKVIQERTADPSKLELFDLIFDRNTPLEKINTCIKKSREHDPKMIHRVCCNLISSQR